MKRTEEFGERLAELVRVTGLNGKQAAAKIGISPSAFSQLVLGKNRPSEQTLRLLVREFGVARNWLQTGEPPVWVSGRTPPILFFDEGNSSSDLIGNLEGWARLLTYYEQQILQMEMPIAQKQVDGAASFTGLVRELSPVPLLMSDYAGKDDCVFFYLVGTPPKAHMIVRGWPQRPVEQGTGEPARYNIMWLFAYNWNEIPVSGGGKAFLQMTPEEMLLILDSPTVDEYTERTKLLLEMAKDKNRIIELQNKQVEALRSDNERLQLEIDQQKEK